MRVNTIFYCQSCMHFDISTGQCNEECRLELREHFVPSKFKFDKNRAIAKKLLTPNEIQKGVIK